LFKKGPRHRYICHHKLHQSVHMGKAFGFGPCHAERKEAGEDKGVHDYVKV
jgi:hypothetical protein